MLWQALEATFRAVQLSTYSMAVSWVLTWSAVEGHAGERHVLIGTGKNGRKWLLDSWTIILQRNEFRHDKQNEATSCHDWRWMVPLRLGYNLIFTVLGSSFQISYWPTFDAPQTATLAGATPSELGLVYSEVRARMHYLSQIKDPKSIPTDVCHFIRACADGCALVGQAQLCFVVGISWAPLTTEYMPSHTCVHAPHMESHAW